ncbi:MAG TPA: sulfite exporter TauE/SafE family protein [Rhodocyclaceae bacterium]|nr:sulfite exporter TauE/SafE family protein [Rhodocyclaceae bacterium]
MVTPLVLGVPLLLGGALGFSGGMFGIGGGIVAVPVLTTFFGMDQKMAQGTALVMMVPNLVIALWRYHQRQPLPLRHTLPVALCAMVTTAITAHFASGLDSAFLRRCFGLFLLWLACYSGWRLYAQSRPAQTEAPSRWHVVLPERLLPLVGILGGACSGLLGIGGGIIATPIFAGWFRQRQVIAQGFALALVTPSTGVALATYAHVGYVSWGIGLALAVGGMGLVSSGVRLAHRLPETRLRSAFAALLGVTAVWMVAGH